MKTPHLLIVCGTVIVVSWIAGTSAIRVASILNPASEPEPTQVEEPRRPQGVHGWYDRPLTPEYLREYERKWILKPGQETPADPAQ
jgi:hypothetical protein